MFLQHVPWIMQLLAALVLGYGVGRYRNTVSFDGHTRKDALFKQLSVEEAHDYGRPGLSHLTVWGAFRDSMNEVEMWMQTFASGTCTPIHRHKNEELFLVLEGEINLRTRGRDDREAKRITAIQNSTFFIPPGLLHQVHNEGDEDARLLVVVGRPPIVTFVHDGWKLESDGSLLFPYTFDALGT